jgi:peptide-methionine (R)-S-oxide reductase
MTLARRSFLGLSGLGAAGALTALWGGFSPVAAETFEFKLSDSEWRKRLTPAQYATLRHAVTERPESSPLDREHRKGIYHCAGCDLALYSSATKFDSGTGWPSFWRPLPNAVRTRSDHALLAERTEVHCRRCGSHLGHVFDDGPPPTHLRYCMNGIALRFVPA